MTLTETASNTLIWTFIPTSSQLLPSTMPVSTATPERSFSTMHTTNLRSTMKTERLSALALMHAQRDIPTDVEAVIWEFCAKKNKCLAFDFSFSSTETLDMSASNLLTTTTTGCILLNIPLFLVRYGSESWHLPVNLSAQIASDYISEYLTFLTFSGGHVP